MAGGDTYQLQAGTYTPSVWTNWNLQACTGATPCYNNLGNIQWQNWNYAYATASTNLSSTVQINFTSPQVWQSWNQNALGGLQGHCQETQVQYIARLAREDTARQTREIETAAQQQKRLKAKRRARLLLADFLTDDQRESLERDKHFIVLSQDGERQYRIREGYDGNVDILGPSGRPIARLCGHLTDHAIPDEDHMLAQLLMLKNNETDFLRVANRTNLAA